MPNLDPMRINRLNERPTASGRYVLYWMQQSQRSRHNAALQHAIARAQALKLPVLAVFGLMDDYPEANARHYAFMLQGLAQVQAELASHGIALVVQRGQPAQVAMQWADQAAEVVCDVGYLRHQRKWRQQIAGDAPCAAWAVEADVVVPVTVASSKPEVAARTLRPKIHRLLPQFLSMEDDRWPRRDSLELARHSTIDLSQPTATLLAGMKLDTSVRPVVRFSGGELEAQSRLDAFVRQRLDGYGEGRSEPSRWQVSTLSPYLHFGQVSVHQIAQRAKQSKAPAADVEVFLEELIVRRELACNYVWFTPHYDRYDALPRWAQQSLEAHAGDTRPRLYSRAQLEAARTQDRYWNACMLEMKHTGYMHNTMRMYWGKKILEWTATPAEAFETALALNNKYFLDGRDPNAYTNVAWCFGLHDRPWFEREIFGVIRYMNDRGLERKYEMDDYIAVVEELVRVQTSADSDSP
jgi:deoxyribodipyrimidine photo-lyase